MIDPLIGVKINDQYLIKEQLGAGGMGCVYKAENLRLGGRPCAIKVLRGDQQDSEQGEIRFQEELNIISQLRSPHIVQVLDRGELSERRLYIVMELLEGESLFSILEREGALSLKRAAQIIQGVLAGLSEAHSHGIIHRDLKPANIFITRSVVGYEIAKILDFGIAKKTQGDNRLLTQTQQILGTPQYMSPEQLHKEQLDQRTDLYAVGLLLYELLSGEPTYQADNLLIPHSLRSMPPEVRVMWLQMHAPPSPLDIPKSLWNICKSLLEKEPTDRPTSATEVIESLTQVVEELDTLEYSKRLTLQSETEVVPQIHYTEAYESAYADSDDVDRADVTKLPLYQQGKLVVLSGDLKGREYLLDRPHMTAGRFPEQSDLLISDTTISGVHAQFVFGDSGFSVIDLDSANGILVNAQVTSEGLLRHEDIVTLGHVQLRYLNMGELGPLSNQSELGGVDDLTDSDHTSITQSTASYLTNYPKFSGELSWFQSRKGRGVAIGLLVLFLGVGLSSLFDLSGLQGKKSPLPSTPLIISGVDQPHNLKQLKDSESLDYIVISEPSRIPRDRAQLSSNQQRDQSDQDTASAQPITAGESSLNKDGGELTGQAETRDAQAPKQNTEKAPQKPRAKSEPRPRGRGKTRKRYRAKKPVVKVVLKIVTSGMFFTPGARLRLKPIVSPTRKRSQLKYELTPKGAGRVKRDILTLNRNLTADIVRIRACVGAQCSHWLPIHIETDDAPE